MLALRDFFRPNLVVLPFPSRPPAEATGMVIQGLPWIVVGDRTLAGLPDRVVLGCFATEELATAARTRFQEHLEGYTAIAVEYCPEERTDDDGPCVRQPADTQGLRIEALLRSAGHRWVTRLEIEQQARAYRRTVEKILLRLRRQGRLEVHYTLTNGQRIGNYRLRQPAAQERQA